jgi:hypothetical protein
MATGRRFWLATAGVTILVATLGVVGRKPAVNAYRARRFVAQRRAYFEMLQPVALTNCELERFGEPNDGGYLMCGNLR